MAGYYDALTVLLFMFEFSCHAISDQQNANIQFCSSDQNIRRYSPVYAKCNATADEVPVPLPHNCSKFKLNASCTSASNYKISLESASITITLRNHTWDCDQQDQFNNNTFSESSSQLLRIEMIQVEKIYAIYINKTYSISTVSVVKSTSLDDNPTSLKYCYRKNISTGSKNEEEFNIFYCYKIEHFTDESIGFDANLIDIKFDLESHSIDACEFQNHIKIFSYPGRLCGTPGSYENQTLEPNLKFYLPGQQVFYRCPDANSISNVDHVWRQCQENGTWSGRAPVCIPGSSHHPEYSYAIEKNVQSSATQCYDTYEKVKNKNTHNGTTTLKALGCVVFDFKKNYETEKIGITFRFGDKNGVVVYYYLKDSAPILLEAMKNYTFHNVSSPPSRTNWYASNDGNNQSVFQPFKTKKLIVLGSNSSGDDTIFNVTLHKPPETEHPRRCPSVDSILKAKWNADPTNLSTNIGYWYCDRGYYDQTNSNSVSANFSCKDGIWFGTPPDCKKTYCYSSEIKTQNVLTNITKRYTNKVVNVNSTLVYSCPEGWFLSGISNDSSIAITCQENGQWSTSENIICVKKTHQNNPEIYSIVGIVISGIIGVTLLLTAFAFCFRKRQTADGNDKNTIGTEENLEENEFVTYVNTNDRPPIESHSKGSLTEEPIIYANVEKEEVVYCEVSFNPDGLKRTKSLNQPSDENETIYATICEPDGFRGSKS